MSLFSSVCLHRISGNAFEVAVGTRVLSILEVSVDVVQEVLLWMTLFAEKAWQRFFGCAEIPESNPSR